MGVLNEIFKIRIMFKKTFLFLALIISGITLATNQPILVTESTITIDFGQTKNLFFSFAEGDEIIFDFQLVKGKNLKEIEVVELPNNGVFSEFKAQKIVGKRITVRNKGLYKFKFRNSSLGRRVCKIKISRIAANESTANFNTNWKWKTIRDTIYTPYTKDSITGYKKINFKEKIKELVNTENVEDLLFNKNQRVNSLYRGSDSRAFLRVDMPSFSNSKLKEEKIIGWAYWIGVGKEAQESYKSNVTAFGNIAKGIASIYGSPLAGLLVGEITELSMPKMGDDVKYFFIPDYENAQKFHNNVQFLQFDMGKGRAAYGKNTNRTQGTFYIGLANDNNYEAIDVEVKVVAIKEVKTFAYKEYDRVREEPVIMTLNKIRVDVKETKIRIPVE